MKITSYFFTFVIFALLVSCKKTSTGIDFSHANYQTLGSYSNTGEPNYLVANDTISSNLETFIHTLMPEQTDLTKTHPELFNAGLNADIKIEKTSDVFITFVGAGTGYSNSFAFYTYPTNNPPTKTQEISNITYIFPSTGYATPLLPGNKVKIGTFDAGTSIGLIILQNGWDTNTATLNNTVKHFCSYAPFNPESDSKLKQHAVLVNYTAENKIIVGFEDLERNSTACDNDFNDVLFYWTIK